MTVKRRVRITVTKIRRQRVQPLPIRALCPHCTQEVETLSLAQSAEVLEVSATTLDCFIAEGRVHAIETVSGNRRICQPSLFSKAGDETKPDWQARYL